MADRPIRIGIIGAGMIAREHLYNYSQLPGVEAAALCDVDEAALARTAAEFGVTDTCTDFRRLLERDDIDAVDVCLHANLHAPAAIAALEAGKHVYCEKPLAGSWRDGKAMLDAAHAAGKLLHIQLRFLYRPDCRMAKQVVDSGALGEIYHLRTFELRRRGRPFVDTLGSPAFVRRRTAGGGALFDIGVYNISRILYLAGRPQVERISGQVYQSLPMDGERRAQSGFDVEETGVGLVHLKGGATLDIFDSWAAHLHKPAHNCILGSQGGLLLSPMHPETLDHTPIEPMQYFSTVVGLETNTTFCEDTIQRRWARTGPEDWWYASSQGNWAAALQGKAELLPTAELALDTLLIQEGIYLSAALGREVGVDEVKAQSQSTMLRL